MTTRTPETKEMQQLVEALLDKLYYELSAPVQSALTEALSLTAVRDALEAMQEEAAQLGGRPLRRDSEAVTALIAALIAALAVARPAVEAALPALAQAAAEAAIELVPQRALSLAGRSNDPFIRPPAQDLVERVGLLGSPAVTTQLDTMGDYVADVIRGQALSSETGGRSAGRVSRRISEIVSILPAALLERFTRSFYLTSYRRSEGEVVYQNRAVLDYVLRVAVLDDATCLTCIGLHGTRLRPGSIIEDHPHGRCTGLPVMKNVSVPIITGEDWLRSQPDIRQYHIMGGANWRAWRDGAVTLQDFISYRDHPVYGRMPVQASLVSILGTTAQHYYGG